MGNTEMYAFRGQGFQSVDFFFCVGYPYSACRTNKRDK